MAVASPHVGSALPGSSVAPERPSLVGTDTTFPVSSNAAADSSVPPEMTKSKKKRHRAGRKQKKRRQSFIAPSEATVDTVDGEDSPSLLQASRTNAAQQASFHRLQPNGNLSNTSLESEALLDHREHAPPRHRKDTMRSGFSRIAMPFRTRRTYDSDILSPCGAATSRATAMSSSAISDDEQQCEDRLNDRVPLLSSTNRGKSGHAFRSSCLPGHGLYGTGSSPTRDPRRASNTSKASSWRRAEVPASSILEEPHNVNNPPSVPGSPEIGAVDNLFIPGLLDQARERDAIIDMTGTDRSLNRGRLSMSGEGLRRKPTVIEVAERDVCFPRVEEGSDHDDQIHEEEAHRVRPASSRKSRRRRTRQWPDLEVLEEWSREEKEELTHQEVLRAKKIPDPVMVGGRLRPAKTCWHREVGDSPFRFTYFNETLDGTIHARTISDLQDGMTFKELFLPDPIELSDDSDDEADVMDESVLERGHHESSMTRQSSVMSKSAYDSGSPPGDITPKPEGKRYGDRPTFWLDVLKPTEMEMKVLGKAFGIHQLTSEDILMDEPREKVELFPSYYFVNYRTFEQDKDSAEYMEPINMYVIVFRHGVITFHHFMSPHPANVRRRIRQLNDYMSPTADWISYAIIDDVTDVYAPLVSEIEREVDEIDQDILYMHTKAADQAVLSIKANSAHKQTKERPMSVKGNRGRQNTGREPQSQADMGGSKADGDRTTGESGGDMLRRVGECRKKVMSLYRLLGNKADVIKGFAKRCNERWEVAPRSEIGLYLGDIQDHIVTMTGNISHFESLLSRAHSNYAAQINIRMNERAEQNADVLGKLTVLGTIVLPMNIITGMWGMNVWVPGQGYEGDLTWFFCITAGLVGFGLFCYFIARKVYGIV